MEKSILKKLEKRKNKKMNIDNKLLPLGSVVLLKDGMQKLVVVGRGALYEDHTTGKDTFADYMGAIYPTGINPETTIFFQHENIDKVIFKGYSDEEEDRFLEIYGEWKENIENENLDGNQTPETFGF